MPKRLTREESRQLTRERLLHAAAELFSRQGFGATSIEDIAETAGYSKGAFYSNFSSKDELFLALFDLHWRQIAPRWAQLSLEDLAPEARWQKGEHLMKQEIAEMATEESRTWTRLLLEFILYALREERARKMLTDRYRQNAASLAKSLEALETQREGPERLSSSDRAWLLHIFSLGMTVHIGLDPEATPNNAWVLPFAVLFDDIHPLRIHHQNENGEPEEDVMLDKT